LHVSSQWRKKKRQVDRKNGLDGASKRGKWGDVLCGLLGIRKIGRRGGTAMKGASQRDRSWGRKRRDGNNCTGEKVQKRKE